MERLETTSPSLSNSPRMRSLPQRGFSWAIVAISSRTSALRRGRPIGPRERQRQKRRHAWRCQRMTLSGRTTTRCRRQSRRSVRTTTQKEFVAGAEPRSLPGRPGQHRELMTEQEILGDQCFTVAYGRTEKAEQKKEILEHRLSILPLSARSRPGRLLHP